jgi:hypothetical protein
MANWQRRNSLGSRRVISVTALGRSSPLFPIYLIPGRPLFLVPGRRFWSILIGAIANFAFPEFSEVRSWKGPGYSHRPNTTNATPTTTAVTTVASNVATITKGILASLGQLFEGVYVLDDDAPILELYRPVPFELAEGPGYRNPLATYHRA